MDTSQSRKAATRYISDKSPIQIAKNIFIVFDVAVSVGFEPTEQQRKTKRIAPPPKRCDVLLSTVRPIRSRMQ
jgi:hypothetical protein